MRPVKLLLPAVAPLAAAARAAAPATDFADMIVPYRRGAIDMAVAELRYGVDPDRKAIFALLALAAIASPALAADVSGAVVQVQQP